MDKTSWTYVYTQYKLWSVSPIYMVLILDGISEHVAHE